MFKESGTLPSIEIVYPTKRPLALQLLVWPAALVVGGLVGMAAFYGAQSYRHDSLPATTALAVGTAKPQPSVVPSAYVLLQGSTPSPDSSPEPTNDPIAAQADVPLPVATPKSKATAVPASPSPKPAPSPSATPTASPSPTPVVTQTPKPYPTASPTSTAKPLIPVQ